MVTARLLTAAGLIPIVAWLIYLGGTPFLALIGLLASVGQIEFSQLIGERGFRPAHLFGTALVWVFLLDARYPDWELLAPGAGGVLVLSLMWQVLRYGRSGSRQWTGSIAGGSYIGACGSYLIRLRALPEDGLWWTSVAVSITLFADSAAYLIGSACGKHKLAPRVSVGKTWEGYAGAIPLSALLGAAWGWILTLQGGSGISVTWQRALVLGGVIATMAPLGDLAISVFKREAGVDNTGRLLPGHGGILDRLDTLLFSAFISYAYIVWLPG